MNGRRKVVLFEHPESLDSYSMRNFSRLLQEFISSRGGDVTVCTASLFFYHLGWNPTVRKWLGYVDQFVVFPSLFRFKKFFLPRDTLFVFCDNALGPWVPMVKNRDHIIHCHDFLALKSALGYVSENPVGKTGKIYQMHILSGLRQGNNFISISKKTKSDLESFVFSGREAGVKSSMVYNGMPNNFVFHPKAVAFNILNENKILCSDSGMFLHVGGGQWYKNLKGILLIYKEWVLRGGRCPLVVVGPLDLFRYNNILEDISDAGGSVVSVRNISGDILNALYSYCDVFLFPSLDEGFGWPIVEAQSCGAMVLTTDCAPMNEIGGSHILYVPRLDGDAMQMEWVSNSVDTLECYLALSNDQKEQLRNVCKNWSMHFSLEKALDGYWDVYKEFLERNAE
jgi:glycosyltransferase involved in cell wall biosynthesis